MGTSCTTSRNREGQRAQWEGRCTCVCTKKTEEVCMEREDGNFGKGSKIKSNQLSMKCRWRTGARRIKAVNSEATPPPVPPWRWVLGFWRGARRGMPPGSETREQALEQRLLGTFGRRDLPKTNNNKKMSSAPRRSDGGKGIRDTHSVVHPNLWRNTSHAGSSDDVCRPPTRCVVRVIHNLMRLGGKSP